jgi:hypothetical protein
MAEESQKIKDKKTEVIVLKPSLNNKDIIQSYILTTARYDFSVYEKRILYGIVECLQSQLAGHKLNKDFIVSEDLRGNVEIELPVSSLLMAGKEDKNHSQIKKALYSLLGKKISYEDEKAWMAFTLIINPEFNKYSRKVTFTLHKKVYKAILDFSKGYRRYELETVMSFRSVYAMRFYELFSGQKKTMMYSIEDLRNMFQLGDKYRLTKDFVKYVIGSAKKELDLKSPYSFIYKLEYEKDRTPSKTGRRKIIAITFTPIYHPEHRDSLLDQKEFQRNLDLSTLLLRDEMDFFLTLGFTEKELKDKHYDLLIDVVRARRQGVDIITDQIWKKARVASDPKAYALQSLKNGAKKYEESLLEQKFGRLSKKQWQEESEYNMEKKSIHSFLKNILNLSGKILEEKTSYLLDRGGSNYLTRLLVSCNGATEKLKEALIKSTKLDVGKSINTYE